MIEFFTATTDYLEDNENYARCYESIFSYRKEKIDNLKGHAAKVSSLAAEMLLMEAFEKLNIAYDGEITVGEHGKPFLTNNKDVFFSISHSGNRVMCAVADSPVGCDLEQTGRVSCKVAKRFFSEGELEVIESLEGEEAKAVMRTKLWCLKESFGKLKGGGLSDAIGKTEFIIDDSFEDRMKQSGMECFFYEEEGYIGAVIVSQDL